MKLVITESIGLFLLLDLVYLAVMLEMSYICYVPSMSALF